MKQVCAIKYVDKAYNYKPYVCKSHLCLSLFVTHYVKVHVYVNSIYVIYTYESNSFCNMFVSQVAMVNG